MIKYKKETNGEATNFSFVKDDYQPQENEFISEARYITEELVESLHSAEYKLSRISDKLKKQAIQFLSETDSKVLPDSSYFEDQQVWIDYRNKLRKVLKGELTEIPEKPF